MIAADIDTLVLGCTHYPLLADVIASVVGPEVTLVNSASETAKQVAQTLQDLGLQRSSDAGSPEHRFVATGDPKPFEVLGQRFLGPEVIEVERHPRRADTVGFPDNAPQ